MRGIMTEAELADALSVSKATIARWRKYGDLPYFRVGARVVRYRADDVAAWLERREGNKAPADAGKTGGGDGDW